MIASAELPKLQGATLGALVNSGAEWLTQSGVAFGHGTTNAADESAWLVLWSLNLPLDVSLDDGAGSVRDRAVSEAEKSKIFQLFNERISSRKPAAYLTQEAWLQGVPFYVDERSIVPRSLIAEVIADGSIDVFLSESTRQVLDLCTGNGSLAILCAMAWPETEITGADISSDALEVARINVEQHGFGEKIALLESDGMMAVPGPWDLIVCNPPYVNRASMLALPQEYRSEPELALAGGDDGMDFIRHLLSDLPPRLNENGVLLLEIGNEREHFEAAFPHLPVFWLTTSAGDDQVLLITRAALCGDAGLR